MEDVDSVRGIADRRHHFLHAAAAVVFDDETGAGEISALR